MTFYVTNQNVVVAVLFGVGFFFGFVFDAFSSLARCLRLPKVIFALFDALYCLVFACFFIIVIYITNYGYVRWYEFASSALGLWLYRIVFDNLISGIFTLLINFVLRALWITVSVLAYPFAAILKLLRAIIRILYFEIRKCSYKAWLGRYSRVTKSKYIKASSHGFKL